MTRLKRLSVCLAGFALAAAGPLSGQETAPAKDIITASVTFRLLGRNDVSSSKFEEYRSLPKGTSVPEFNLTGRLKGLDFSLFATNVSQRDQRYLGLVRGGGVKVVFDYNEIEHNIGFDGRSLFNQTSSGVWSLSPTLRSLLQTAWDATPSANRTYPWLLDFWGPSLATGGRADVSLQRNRGSYVADLSGLVGFGLKLSYQRETRRGAKDTTPVYVASQIFELPTPTDYLTQDFGLTASLDRKWGNLHAGFRTNWFTNNNPLMIVDNPLRATDAAYVNPIGGPAQGHNVMAPDNTATTVSFGALLKLGRKTRLLGDVTRSRWKQNAAFAPYTFNTAILTADGKPANSLSSLPAASLNGLIDVTTLFGSFLTRPWAPLSISLRYRSYDLDNKTPQIVSPGYASWDRSWSTTGNTSVPYGIKTGRFDAIIGLDLGRTLALEGAYRWNDNRKTFREVEKTVEQALALSAVYRGLDWALLRAVYETAKRKAHGIEVGFPDLLFDEAERESSKAGLDLELSPFGPLTFLVAIFDRKDTYRNPSWGYQSAHYQTLTGEVDLDTKRFDATFYYTKERNRDGHKGYQTISSVLEWYTAMADDKTDSLGASLKLALVPDKWDASAHYSYQKVNGFLDLAGSAAIEATRAGNGGIMDVPDFDDTSRTLLQAQLSYAVSPDCTLALGAWSERYRFNDASVQVGLYFPAPGVFSLAPDNGGYAATVYYSTLTFRW